MSGARLECRLAQAARRFPGQPALVTPETSLSFAELDARVSERAAALQSQAVGGGAWVIARTATAVDGVVDWLALLRAGARALPVSGRMPAETLRELAAEHAIPLCLPAPGAAAAATGAAEALPPAQGLQYAFAPEAPCAGVLTSGSTGRPRVAVHSYANHVRSAEGSATLLPLAPGDRYLLSLPLNHVGGLAIIVRCLTGGAAMVLGGRAEDADFLERLGVTHVSMVETQLRRLLDAGRPIPERLRCALLGGGPVAPELVSRAAQQGLPCCVSYGLTEMASQVVTHTPAGEAVVLPHRECRLGADGEILVRGGTLFLGYLAEGRLRPATDEAGWFHTRDLGRWRAGRLELLGRKDNQFISGGENVQPEAIERVLREHPGISEAVVVPRSDPDLGQRPVAFLEGDAIPADTALHAWLRERLSPPLRPAAFHPLPRREGLKVRRAELIELAEQRPA